MKELALNKENKKVSEQFIYNGYDIYVDGYEISNTYTERIFRHSKQLYIIPVYVTYSWNADKTFATGSTVATTVSNIKSEDDAKDIFVPTECVVIHLSSSNFDPMRFVGEVCESV